MDARAENGKVNRRSSVRYDHSFRLSSVLLQLGSAQVSLHVGVLMQLGQELPLVVMVFLPSSVSPSWVAFPFYRALRVTREEELSGLQIHSLVQVHRHHQVDCHQNRQQGDCHQTHHQVVRVLGHHQNRHQVDRVLGHHHQVDHVLDRQPYLVDLVPALCLVRIVANWIARC